MLSELLAMYITDLIVLLCFFRGGTPPPLLSIVIEKNGVVNFSLLQNKDPFTLSQGFYKIIY